MKDMAHNENRERALIGVPVHISSGRGDDRGFKGYGMIKAENRAEITVQESSAAEGPHLWLRVEHPPPRYPGKLPAGEVSAHITLEQAERRRDALDEAIRNHSQLS